MRTNRGAVVLGSLLDRTIEHFCRGTTLSPCQRERSGIFLTPIDSHDRFERAGNAHHSADVIAETLLFLQHDNLSNFEAA
jgi:hypothetical protein